MTILNIRKIMLITLFTAGASASHAQRTEQLETPIKVKPLPKIDAVGQVRGTVALAVPRLVARPNATNAAVLNARIRAINARVRQRPKIIAVVMGQSAGVRQLNGAAGGVLEPGGDYEFGGSGFGTSTGSVFMRHQGRTIPMRVTHWSDGQIFASVPDDISGLPDARSIELAVGPAGQSALITKRFGFRAARVDRPMIITDAMFSHDPGRSTRLYGIDIPSNIAPSSKAYDGESFAVFRSMTDEGGTKRCFEPGIDRIRIDVPLNPGFEITGAYFTHIGCNRGRYAMTWEPGMLRVDYGVQRHYDPKFVFVGGSGSCNSRYTVKVTVTGPRGMPMQ